MMNKTWLPEHEQFVKDNAHLYNDEKLTKELNAAFQRNFSIAATRKKRQRLALIKEGHRGFFKMKQSDETSAEEGVL